MCLLGDSGRALICPFGRPLAFGVWFSGILTGAEFNDSFRRSKTYVPHKRGCISEHIVNIDRMVRF